MKAASAFVLLGLWVAAGSARAQVDDGSLLHRGKMEAGLELALSYGNTSDSYGDSYGFNLNPGLFFGYMLTDRLELRAEGYYQLELSSSGSQSQSENVFGGLVQGLYHLPLTPWLACYVGAGTGGFGAVVQQQYSGSSAGWIGQLLTGLLIELGNGLVLRTGLRGDLTVAGLEFNQPALGPDVAILPPTTVVQGELFFEAAASWRF